MEINKKESLLLLPGQLVPGACFARYNLLISINP